MNTINRDIRDQALDAEDCSSHCPQWLILSIVSAALASVLAAALIG
jgi:hypothetical protein